MQIDGRFEIGRILGEGGQAVVVGVVDRRLNVDRALKILLPDMAARSKHRARFESEARTMALLDHPHIVRVHDVCASGRTVYSVMDFVPGGSLMAYLEREGPLAPALAVRTTLQICAGLVAAHAAGVVHRDIKPHNVLIARDGTVKLADFGIARTTESHHTSANAAMGTFGYVAPEQLRDARSADARADIYGVGMTLFALLTGADPAEWLKAHRHPLLPWTLQPIVERATAESPDGRYATVSDLVEALEASLGPLPKDDAVLKCIEGAPADTDGEGPSLDEVASWFSSDSPDRPPRSDTFGAGGDDALPQPLGYSMSRQVGARGQDSETPGWLVEGPPEGPRGFKVGLEGEDRLRVRRAEAAPRWRLPLGLVGAVVVLVGGLIVLLAYPFVQAERVQQERRVESERQLRAEVAAQRETVDVLASLGADGEHLGALLETSEAAEDEEERARAAVMAFTALDHEARRLLVERSDTSERIDASLTALDRALDEYLAAHPGSTVVPPPSR